MSFKKLIKYGLVLILSLIIIMNFNQVVRAADGDDDWTTPGTANAIGSGGNNTSGGFNNTIEPANTNVNKTSNSNTNANATNKNSNTNRVGNSSSNEIPYTGVGSVGNFVVVAIVLGTIVAVYSFKKFSDYRGV